MSFQSISFSFLVSCALLVASCTGKKAATQETIADDTIDATNIVSLEFSADSAYGFCAAQCNFGPRVMNSAAHDKCGKWISEKFRSYGLDVIEQDFTQTGYDGKTLNCKNIIAQYRPEKSNRVLVCAHWDSRPWADNDPDPANHHKPIDAANDGASGVAVMLEIARVIVADSAMMNEKYGNIGVDFVCFDAEDYGVPQWAAADFQGNSDETWALGAQYWSKNPHKQNYSAYYGILLDMVGGQGAKFHKEYFSQKAANSVLENVWAAAMKVGFGNYFINDEGGAVNDDHIPVINNARIPCIDIIPYHADNESSSFGPTWHTVNDNMQNISKETLKAVGQTVIQAIFED